MTANELKEKLDKVVADGKGDLTVVNWEYECVDYFDVERIDGQEMVVIG